MKTSTKITTTLTAVILATLALTGASAPVQPSTPSTPVTPVTVASCEANECHAGSIDFYSGLAPSTPVAIGSFGGSSASLEGFNFGVPSTPVAIGPFGGSVGTLEGLDIGATPSTPVTYGSFGEGRGGASFAAPASSNTPTSDALALSKALKTGFSENIVSAHPYALTCLTPKADGTYLATYVFTKDGYRSDFSAVRELADSDFCLPSVTYPTQTIEEQTWSPSYSVVKQEFESARLVYSQDRNGLFASTVYSATDTAPSPELAEAVSEGFGGNPAYYVVTSTDAVVLK